MLKFLIYVKTSKYFDFISTVLILKSKFYFFQYFIFLSEGAMNVLGDERTD
jgi:hypothetical protein